MVQRYQERKTRGSMELTTQLVYSNDEIQLQEETLSLKLRWTVTEEDTRGHHPVSTPVHWYTHKHTFSYATETDNQRKQKSNAKQKMGTKMIKQF